MYIEKALDKRHVGNDTVCAVGRASFGPLEETPPGRILFVAMYLLYLDDSGSAQNASESHLVLGGVCVYERQVHWISEAMDKLAQAVWPNDPSSVEFHASEIHRGAEHPWSNIVDRDRRHATLTEVLLLVPQAHESTCLFACAVHKESYPDEDPMEIAFEELCNRFDRFLIRLYTQQNDRQRGLLILDKSTYETSLQRLAKTFKTLGTRWGVLRNQADVPMFVDSRASRLVQLADCVAYAVYRRYERGDTKYFDTIAHRFDKEGAVVHGLVHKQKKDPNCMCLSCASRKYDSPIKYA